MVFSSLSFIYLFLPVLLAVYFLAPNKFKNSVLLFFSLLFYFLGEPTYIVILILSCIINYYASKGIERYPKHQKLILIIALIYNIGQLFYFKYTNFAIENLNQFLNLNITLKNIVMPLGISFFTFQALSYVIDVYRKEICPAKSVWTFATYLTLFPQLVAGPIVRYSAVEEELTNRTHSFDNFSYGVQRFSIGLAKKVILANTLGALCKTLSSMMEITILSSWLNAIAFTLQIYFDFSGYSDMAIGLGKMFGFTFQENFNYPFIASSITNFWRRWHISLSSFFRDYVYIPLGGNRVSKLKWIRNIMIVWFLTGLWHGASWNFIIWGLFFAVLLIIEKLWLKKYLEKTKIVKYLYTIFLVIISFTIFNASSLSEVLSSLKNMFGINGIPLMNLETIYYLRSYAVILLLAILLSTPLMSKIGKKVCQKYSFLEAIGEPILYLGLMLIATAFLVDSTFNPFLYFRF